MAFEAAFQADAFQTDTFQILEPLPPRKGHRPAAIAKGTHRLAPSSSVAQNAPTAKGTTKG